LKKIDEIFQFANKLLLLHEMTKQDYYVLMESAHVLHLVLTFLQFTDNDRKRVASNSISLSQMLHVEEPS